MKTFTFSESKKIIVKKISEAQEFIKIVSFQLTNKEILELIIKKQNQGVEVDILTLPPDSFSNVDQRGKLKQMFEQLKSSGVRILENKWEVGDTSLTSTSQSGDIKAGGGSKWYSLHGKFLVTEKCALVTSSNLDEENNLEVFLSYEEDNVIEEFCSEFGFLQEYFIKQETEEVPGSFFEELPPNKQENISSSYSSMERLNIEEYPSELLEQDFVFEQGLVITPFEAKARNILNKIIENSEDFLYLVSENLYDEGVVSKLGREISGVDLDTKILTGPPSNIRQNINKAREMYRKVASFGADVRSLDQIHCKLWMNEKWMVVGSVNLTKMSLGFGKNDGWRANTETLYLERTSEIKNAKSSILDIFSRANSLLEVISSASSSHRDAKQYFDYFDHYSRTTAKKAFGKIKTNLSLDHKKTLLKIAEFAAKLAKEEDETYINEPHVIMGGVLQKLKQRSLTMEELKASFQNIFKEDKMIKAINNLQDKNYIKQNKERYEINIQSLLN